MPQKDQKPSPHRNGARPRRPARTLPRLDPAKPQAPIEEGRNADDVFQTRRFDPIRSVYLVIYSTDVDTSRAGLRRAKGDKEGGAQPARGP